MRFYCQLCFLLSILRANHADRSDATSIDTSQHDVKQQVTQESVLDIGNKGTMQTHSDIQGRHNASASSTKGSFLSELYLCGRPEDLPRFELGPFAHSVSYNGFDLSGSTWKDQTFLPGSIPGLGFRSDLIGTQEQNVALSSGGTIPVKFAFINSGPAYAPGGGYIFKRTDSNEVIGANEVCSQDSDYVTYRLTFKEGIDVGSEVPQEFSIGRMQQVTLPELQAAGAKRYTWLHKVVAQKYFSQYNSDIRFGGFLYEVQDGTQAAHLEFYERLPFPYSCPWDKTNGGSQSGCQPYNGGSGAGGNSKNITITLHINQPGDPNGAVTMDTVGQP